MYTPRQWHFFYPVLTILLGFWLRERYGDDWNTGLAQILLGIAALIHAVYLLYAGILYQKYQTREESPYDPMSEKNLAAKAAEAYAEKHGLSPLPKVKAYGEALQLPSFDRERQFAISLLRMAEGGKVDLTEDKWVDTKKFTRTEFKAMLGLWEEYGLIEREDYSRTNSPYVVKNWDKVRAVADGNPIGNKPRKEK
jgi:hypothetical protein